MNTRAQDVAGEPPEGALTAAEYVLGLLNAMDRRSAAARVQREPAFAAEVGAWERRLAPLIQEIVPVPVPFALWPRIQSAAGIEARDAREMPRETGLWQRLSLWRWLSAAAFATAAASLAALFLATRPPPAPAARELVATMAQDDGKPLFAATVDAVSGRLVVLPLAVDIPADRAAELWLIAPGAAPRSLGLLDPRHARSVIVPASLRSALSAKAIVAVSLEPPGGAPHGQPTGPIIAKGEIALL